MNGFRDQVTIFFKKWQLLF